MAGDDVELEIDDLPNEVQHKLLKYVRSIFPKQRASPEEAAAVDDDYYEPERNPRSGAAKKKHKPMKKQEQEHRIAALKQKMSQMKGVADGIAGDQPAQNESSGDEASESSGARWDALSRGQVEGVLATPTAFFADTMVHIPYHEDARLDSFVAFTFAVLSSQEAHDRLSLGG